MTKISLQEYLNALPKINQNGMVIIITWAARCRVLKELCFLFLFFVVVVVLVGFHVWYMIVSQLYIIGYIVSHTVHIDDQ